MKKVFMIHGFEGEPNGGWRPWLMGELAKLDTYACALSMPTPDKPVCAEWVEEIKRHVDRSPSDDVYLVGHSLGVPAILRFLESSYSTKNVRGLVLVSGPIENITQKPLGTFFTQPFDFKKVKELIKKITVIHGSNDRNVSVKQGETLAKELDGDLVIVENGQHLNGSAGWTTLPQALKALEQMMRSL